MDKNKNKITTTCENKQSFSNILKKRQSDIKNIYTKIQVNNTSIIGYILKILHYLLPFFMIIILLFSNDIINLLIMLLIIKILLIMNYRCNDCPVSLIEDDLKSHEMGFSIANDIGKMFIGPKYKEKERSLIILEFFWILGFLVILKIMGIIAFRAIGEFIYTSTLKNNLKK
jgi:hypothetical protein